MSRYLPTMAFAVAMSLSGCAIESIAGLRSSDIVEDAGVRVTLHVRPAVVYQPGTTVATLEYENTTSRTIVISSGYGCLAFAGVYRGSTRIPFPSTEYLCTAAGTARNLEPGTPLVMEWPLVLGGPDGVNVLPGTYRFAAQLNTHADTLEQEFTVR